MSSIEKPEEQEQTKVVAEEEEEVKEEKSAVSKPVLDSNIYKMPRVIAFFPECEKVSKDQLINIRKLFNEFDFAGAHAAVQELNLDLVGAPDLETLKILVTAWKAKAYYRQGDYKSSLDIVDEEVEKLQTEYLGLSMEYEAKGNASVAFDKDTQSNSIIAEVDKNEQSVPEPINFLYLKLRILQAQINQAIAMNHKCEEICNSIILYVKKFKDDKPQQWWWYAAKAANIQALQLCTAREFDPALLLLNNISKRIAFMIGEHHFALTEKELGKVLQDNYYSFEYRKMQARHYMHFVDFRNAENQLRILLNDELLYYKLNTKEIEKRTHIKKGEDAPAFDLDLIDLKAAFQNVDTDQYKYNRRSLPISKVLDTMLMLAEVLSFRRKSEEALKLFDYVQKGFYQLFGTDNSLRNSYLEQQLAESYLKSITTRDSSKVTDAIEHAQKSVSIIETIIGKTEDGPEINNCLLALRIQTLADCQKEAEEIEICEKTFKRSHQMAVNMGFGENHPYTVMFNGNIVIGLSLRLYMSKDDEERKRVKDEISEIIEKNLKIVTETFGEDSIHLLYYLNSDMTNRYALGEVTAPEITKKIKQMQVIIVKFHGGDPRKLSNQLFFQQQLQYARVLDENVSNSSQSKANVKVELMHASAQIYAYIYAAQHEYCRLDKKHPFMEQTYISIAMFNRNLKRYAESLAMWKELEALQTELYGVDSMVLLFTWKNIGTCYMGVGKSEDARHFMNKAMALMQGVMKDTDKEEQKKKDQIEMASLYQNLYLTYIGDRENEKANECTEKAQAIISSIFGPRSKRLASKYYQRANNQLTMGNLDAALADIETAIDIQNNPEPDLYVPEEDKDKEATMSAIQVEAQNYNRIQFQNFLCSARYMQGTQLDKVIKDAQVGIELCSAYSYELLKPEMTRMKEEFEGIKLKAEARMNNTCAMNLKEGQSKANSQEEQDEENKVLAQKQGLSSGAILSTFVISSGLVYLGLLGLQKMSKAQ